MVCKTVRQVRAADCVEQMPKGYYWTFTTPDVVDYMTITSRWRGLRHEITRYIKRRRKGASLKYIMNFERHPKGHGWHIHCVLDAYLPIDYVRRLCRQFGFGRVNVKAVFSGGISEYLTKHCLKAYRQQARLSGVSRVRLVNVSRGLPSLSSYRWESSNASMEKAVRSKLHFRGITPRVVGVKKFSYLFRMLTIFPWVDDDDFDLQLSQLW